MARITNLTELPKPEVKMPEPKWAEWAQKGRVVILTEGKDFSCKASSFPKTAREQCKALGLAVECRVVPKTNGKNEVWVLVKGNSRPPAPSGGEHGAREGHDSPLAV